MRTARSVRAFFRSIHSAEAEAEAEAKCRFFDLPVSMFTAGNIFLLARVIMLP
jgi:hypothetical protein